MNFVIPESHVGGGRGRGRGDSLHLFTFCFYIGKNTYHELVRMLYVLLASLDRFHPDFFLVVYHNLGIGFVIDDPRVSCRKWEVNDGDGERLLLEADGCDGNVWVEGSAVRNRWHKLSFNKIHVFKTLYDEYGGVCFTWIDLDSIVLADLSYLNSVDNYFIIHGGGDGQDGEDERIHDVLLGADGSVIWSIPERLYIQGSFWKLNLSLYHEVLRLDSLFRENGVKLKYDLQSIFAVMAWGYPPTAECVREETTDIIHRASASGASGGSGGSCERLDVLLRINGSSDSVESGEVSEVSQRTTNYMHIIGENFMPHVMNGLGVWDTKNAVGNHVNTESLANFGWRRRGTNDDANDIFYTKIYPDKEIHILSLTFDSFFMSNVSQASDFARLFPFLLV